MHTFAKKLTFAPLKGGRYRCNQTGDILTKAQIPSYITNALAGNRVVVRVSAAPANPAKKQKVSNHPSKYRAKHG